MRLGRAGRAEEGLQEVGRRPGVGRGNDESFDRLLFFSLYPLLFHVSFYFCLGFCVLCLQTTLSRSTHSPSQSASSDSMST